MCFGSRVYVGGGGLDRECMELVTECFFLFSSFFLVGGGGRGPAAPCFSKQYSNYFPDAPK